MDNLSIILIIISTICLIMFLINLFKDSMDWAAFFGILSGISIGIAFRSLGFLALNLSAAVLCFYASIWYLKRKYNIMVTIINLCAAALNMSIFFVYLPK